MGADKELLRKYHLEEAQKRFQQISEYTFITKPLLDEDGDDEQNQEQQSGQDNGNGGGMGNQQPPQGDNQGGNDMSAGPANGADGGDMQQPPMGGADPTKDGGQNGVAPEDMPDGGGQEDVDFEPEDGNVDSMKPDDEVIDVDELTKAQETAEVKIDGVNDKLQNMLNVMNKFIAAIDNNDRKIDDLRAEFEKRNPSEEEKINIRSQASAPYSETPKDFWEKKSQDSNYNVIFNNDVDPDKEEKEYIIRKSDINGTDDRGLAKSLDYPSKLEDFLNF